MFNIFKRRRYRRKQIKRKDYLEKKEQTRFFVLAKIAMFNRNYNFVVNKIFIRNQRTCWGSCSANKNLNFNYRLLYLPEYLKDYVIVHELCHLKELNHSKAFWDLVSKTVPDWKKRRKELRKIKIG